MPIPLLLTPLAVFFPGAEQPPPPLFSNTTQVAGIGFTHLKGNKGVATILEEAGPGVCVADYDGDGLNDIFIANGTTLKQANKSAPRLPDRRLVSPIANSGSGDGRQQRRVRPG